MDFLANLWLPILLSGVAVFLVSSVIHMVLPVHRNDFAALPDEDALRAAMREHGVTPGNYHFPHCTSMKDMEDPAMQAKWKEGPVGFMTVMPSGMPAMGKALLQWFVFTLFVGLFVAYATWLAVGATGADPRHVFRIAATIAVLGYGAGSFLESIWKGLKWSTSIKFFVDGLLYGLATGGVFMWLWPEAAG